MSTQTAMMLHSRNKPQQTGEPLHRSNARLSLMFGKIILRKVVLSVPKYTSYIVLIDERRMLMITEEMLREAVHKAAELMAAYYERDYDPEKEIEVSPEFEKRMRDLIDGKLQDQDI